MKVDKERLCKLIREGWDNKQIARLLGCSVQVVQYHRRTAFPEKRDDLRQYKLGDTPQLMGEDEIVRHWKEMRSKINGIKILAELNLCREDVIIEILRRHGCDARRRRSRWDKREEITT